MWPDLASSIPGRKARTVRNSASVFTEKVSTIASSLCSSRRLPLTMPALLISTSTLPCSATTRAAAASIDARSPRSQACADRTSPRAATRARAVSSAAASTSQRINRPPRVAIRSAISKPMPLAAPVTSTLRSRKSVISGHRRGRQEALEPLWLGTQPLAAVVQRDAAALEHDRLVGDPQYERRMLLDDDRRHPFLAHDAPQRGEQLLDDDRCQPLERLVEQQQSRVEHQRARDGQHLLLATRELAAQVLAPLGE